jgi:hypothetical protein
MDMTRNLLEFAQKLAEGARAKVDEDRRRLEKMQAQLTAGDLHAKSPTPAR